MASIQGYFPPQVLRDINFFNVRSPTEAAYRLRTLQRVAAAGLGAYLFFRYEPLKQLQVSHIPYASAALDIATFFAGYSVCSPAAFLILGGATFYEGSVKILSGAEHKIIGRIVLGALMVGFGYINCHLYRTIDFCFYSSPDPLDKVFTIVAARYSEPMWRRFYSK